MKSIVPSPRGQVRAAAAASLPVLARIPDVSTPEPKSTPTPESSGPPQQPETEDVVTKKINDLPPQPDKIDQTERPIAHQMDERDRTRERTRQPRLPQGKSPRPKPKEGPRNQRRPTLPPMGYLFAGLMAVLLIVIVVLLTRNHDSAPNSEQSPPWPSEQDTYAEMSSEHNHEHVPGEPGGAETGSALGQHAGDTAGMESPYEMPPAFAPQTEPAGDVSVPGVVRLNGTIDKPDLQAQQPSENGVYPPR